MSGHYTENNAPCLVHWQFFWKTAFACALENHYQSLVPICSFYSDPLAITHRSAFLSRPGMIQTWSCLWFLERSCASRTGILGRGHLCHALASRYMPLIISLVPNLATSLMKLSREAWFLNTGWLVDLKMNCLRAALVVWGNSLVGNAKCSLLNLFFLL